MQMVMDTLLELPVNQGKLYQELQKSGYGSDRFFQYCLRDRKKGENRFCNATGQEGLYKN